MEGRGRIDGGMSKSLGKYVLGWASGSGKAIGPIVSFYSLCLSHYLGTSRLQSDTETAAHLVTISAVLREGLGSIEHPHSHLFFCQLPSWNLEIVT